MRADIALLVLREIKEMINQASTGGAVPQPPLSVLSSCLRINDPQGRKLCLADPRGAGYHLYMKHLLEFMNSVVKQGHTLRGEEEGLHRAYISFIDTIQQLAHKTNLAPVLDEPLCIALETPIEINAGDVGAIVVDKIIACIPPLNMLRDSETRMLEAEKADDAVESMLEIGLHMSRAALYIETRFPVATHGNPPTPPRTTYTRRYISYTAYKTLKEMGCIEASVEDLVTIELSGNRCTASLGGRATLIGPGLTVFTNENGDVTCIVSETIRSLAALSPNGITVPCKSILGGTGSNTLQCRLRAS